MERLKSIVMLRWLTRRVSSWGLVCWLSLVYTGPWAGDGLHCQAPLLCINGSWYHANMVNDFEKRDEDVIQRLLVFLIWAVPSLKLVFQGNQVSAVAITICGPVSESRADRWARSLLDTVSIREDDGDVVWWDQVMELVEEDIFHTVINISGGRGNNYCHFAVSVEKDSWLSLRGVQLMRDLKEVLRNGECHAIKA